MLSHCKLLGLLTPYQAELLKRLADLALGQPNVFWRPRELGAYRSSHHAATLRQLELQGWVSRLELSKGAVRPNFGYRITAKGVETLESFKLLADVPLESVLGRAADRSCAAYAKQLFAS